MNSHCTYIGSVRGVAVYVNFLVLPAVVMLLVSGGMGLCLLVLPTFIIHEASHLLAAYLFNIKICTFTLLPIGGSMQPDTSTAISGAQLAAVHLFAPFVNIMLWCSVYAVGLWTDSLVCMQFAFINGFVAVFNLLPIYPLDGGNSIKALLSKRLNEQKTLKLMLAINVVAALLATALTVNIYIHYRAVLWQIPTVCVFFVYSAYVQRHSSTGSCVTDVINRDSMLKRSITLTSRCIYVFHTATIAHALKCISHDAVNTFRVVDGDMNVIGELTEKQLLNAAAQLGPNANICSASEIKKHSGARILL